MPNSSPENAPMLPEKLEAFKAILAEETRDGRGSEIATFLNELAQKGKLGDFMLRLETLEKNTSEIGTDERFNTALGRRLGRLEGLLTPEEKQLLDQQYTAGGYPAMGSALSNPQARLRNRNSVFGAPAIGDLMGGMVYLVGLLAAAGITVKTAGALAIDGVKYGVDKQKLSHVQQAGEKVILEKALEKDKAAAKHDGKELGVITLSAAILGIGDWLRTKTKSDRDFLIYFEFLEQELSSQLKAYKNSGKQAGLGERQ